MSGRAQQAPPFEEFHARVAALIRPEVLELSAYHVPAPGDAIKLDAMENPYPWPGELVDAWLDALRGVTANRYPDPSASHLVGVLRRVMDVPEGAGILLGNGSDELIQMLLLAVAGPGRAVMAPEPTFVMYRLLSKVLGLEFVGVPLDPSDFALGREAMMAALERHRPAVVFLAYPNNPTGNLFDADVVEAVIRAAPGLVVVDEAYTPFAEASFLPRLAEFPNLLVMRTVSKMGLAGLRLGWLAGGPAWVEQLNKVRLPYNINILTQVSAGFALEHHQTLGAQTARIREDREVLWRELDRTEGVTPWPSRANFVLFRVGGGRAGRISASLREQGVLIKNLDGSAPGLEGCLRVTVGTPDENRAFLAALEAALRIT